jgi:hypothetical protein
MTKNKNKNKKILSFYKYTSGCEDRKGLMRMLEFGALRSSIFRKW